MNAIPRRTSRFIEWPAARSSIRNSSTSATSASCRTHAKPGLDQADEGIDPVVGDERADGRQRADHLDGVRRQADLLVGLAQGGLDQRLAGIAAAARERDLARVAPEIVAALGEHGVQSLAGVDEQRHEHGGVRAAAMDLDRQRLLGRQERGAQIVAQAQLSSTRSSNATSPSSVRCTGHLAAITCRRSTCSSLRCPGIRMTSSKRVGQPRSAGE